MVSDPALATRSACSAGSSTTSRLLGSVELGSVAGGCSTGGISAGGVLRPQAPSVRATAVMPMRMDFFIRSLLEFPVQLLIGDQLGSEPPTGVGMIRAEPPPTGTAY